MKKILYFLLIVLLIIQGCQSSFELISLDNVDFIIPPESSIDIDLDKNGNYEVSEYQKYFYIYIDSLLKQKSYYNAVNLVNKAQNFVSNKDFVTFSKDLEINKLEEINFSHTFLKIGYGKDKNRILIQVDYRKLISEKNKTEINFLTLAKDIVIELSEKELLDFLPKGISQNILEKVFEYLPLPQQLILTRYLFDVNKNYSFLLLNPKIYLSVDVVERVWPILKQDSEDPEKIEPDKKKWQTEFLGQSVIKFYRNDNSLIEQSPFLRLKKILSSNEIESPRKIKSTLQASSADIQLSELTKDKIYIFLFQNDFKGNNHTDDSSILDYKNDISAKNSQLLFTNKINSNFFNRLSTFDEPAQDYDSILSSSFGQRNLITPVISIFINGLQKTIKLNSDINILKQQGDIPLVKEINVYRIFNGSYYPVKNFNDYFILLPNDKINF